jgi:hypothetical protein
MVTAEFPSLKDDPFPFCQDANPWVGGVFSIEDDIPTIPKPHRGYGSQNTSRAVPQARIAAKFGIGPSGWDIRARCISEKRKISSELGKGRGVYIDSGTLGEGDQMGKEKKPVSQSSKTLIGCDHSFS